MLPTIEIYAHYETKSHIFWIGCPDFSIIKIQNDFLEKFSFLEYIPQRWQILFTGESLPEPVLDSNSKQEFMLMTGYHLVPFIPLSMIKYFGKNFFIEFKID